MCLGLQNGGILSHFRLRANVESSFPSHKFSACCNLLNSFLPKGSLCMFGRNVSQFDARKKVANYNCCVIVSNNEHILCQFTH